MMGRIPLPDQKKVKEIDKKLKDTSSSNARKFLREPPKLTQSPMGVVQPPKRGK